MGCHTFPQDPNETRWPAPPSDPPLTFLSGRVFEFGSTTPLSGAVVMGNTSQANSDVGGYYVLDGQRSSQILVVAAKEGYDTLRVSLVVNGGNQTYNVFLRRQQ
jgi:hypothetical protein